MFLSGRCINLKQFIYERKKTQCVTWKSLEKKKRKENNFLPESAGSEVDVVDGVGVLVVLDWLLCSKSGEDVGGGEEEDAPELSTDVEEGGAVTVDDDPEEEEMDFDMGAAPAASSSAAAASDGAVEEEDVAAAAAVSSVPSASAGVLGTLDSWLETSAGGAGGFDVTSGRMAVPERRTRFILVKNTAFTSTSPRHKQDADSYLKIIFQDTSWLHH